MIHFLWMIIGGFVVGLLARAVLPGSQHMGFILSTIRGIAGAVLGGVVSRLVSKPEEGTKFHPAGFILSLIGAVIVL